MPISPSSKSVSPSASIDTQTSKGHSSNTEGGFNALLEIVAQVLPSSTAALPLGSAKATVGASASDALSRGRREMEHIATGSPQGESTPSARVQVLLDAAALESKAPISTDSPSDQSTVLLQSQSGAGKKEMVSTGRYQGQPIASIKQLDGSLVTGEVTPAYDEATTKTPLSPEASESQFPYLTSLNSASDEGSTLCSETVKQNASLRPMASAELPGSKTASVTPRALPPIALTAEGSSAKQTLQQSDVLLSVATKLSDAVGAPQSNRIGQSSASIHARQVSKGDESAYGPGAGSVTILPTIQPVPSTLSVVVSNVEAQAGFATHVPLEQLATVISAHIAETPELPSTLHLRIFPKDLGVLNIHISGVDGSLTVKMDGSSSELGSQLSSHMGELAKELQESLSVKISLNLGSFGHSGPGAELNSHELISVGTVSLNGLAHRSGGTDGVYAQKGTHLVDLHA